MSQEFELKRLERSVFTSFFQDGLWDIYGGLILLGFGIGMITGKIIWQILLITIALVIILFRKRIIMSRMGYVRFSPARETQVKRNKIIAVIAGAVLLILGLIIMFLFSADSVAPWAAVVLRDYFLVIFGAILGGLVAIAAFVIGVKRYYGYAALLFIAFTLGQMAERYSDNFDAGMFVFLTGIIIVASGIILFMRFLRANPPASMNN